MKVSTNLHLILSIYLYFLLTITWTKAEDSGPTLNFDIEYTNTNGESCDSDDPWEYPCRFPLVCTDRLCTCPMKTQIYIPEQENCYSTIDGICKDSAGVHFPCVQGSICSENKTCTCLPRHKKRPDGALCSPLKVYEESCAQNEDCDDFLNLSCLNGICTCDKLKQVYNSEFQKCVGLSGSRCNSGKPVECTLNSVCNPSTETCICDEGYSASTGQCGRAFEASCGYNNLTCSDIFSCVNNQCKCPDPYNQYFEKDENRCLHLASGPCEVNLIAACGKNSECREVEGQGYSECQCSAGYVEDGRFCRESFGASCDFKNGCAKPLECVDGFCICANRLTEFDASGRKCIGLRGSGCEIGKDVCVAGANCVQNLFGEQGKCICDNGAQVGNSRRNSCQ